MDTRRSFLKDFAGGSCAFLFFQGCPPIPRPRRKTPLDPPGPLEKQDEEKATPISPSVRLRVQEKEFRETIEQLFIRVRDLRSELEHVPTAQIFFSEHLQADAGDRETCQAAEKLGEGVNKGQKAEGRGG